MGGGRLGIYLDFSFLPNILVYALSILLGLIFVFAFTVISFSSPYLFIHLVP